MFSFLLLINNPVTNGLSFLLLSRVAMIWSKTINNLGSLFGLYSSILL